MGARRQRAAALCGYACVNRYSKLICAVHCALRGGRARSHATPHMHLTASRQMHAASFVLEELPVQLFRRRRREMARVVGEWQGLQADNARERARLSHGLTV